MRTEFDDVVENQMIQLSLLGNKMETKEICKDLQEACKEMEEMLKSKNPAKDDLFAGFPRVKAEIIISAMALVKTDEWKAIFN